MKLAYLKIPTLRDYTLALSEAQTASLYKCATIHNVFESVRSGAADKGVVPIENNHAGTEYDTYDELNENGVAITGEFYHTDKKKNLYTRFLVVAQQTNSRIDCNKVSLIFVVSDEPGSLYGALAVFESYELNLSKIESRAVFGRPYPYLFYVDFEYSDHHKMRMDEIIAVYQENTQYLKVLGYYQSATKPL